MASLHGVAEQDVARLGWPHWLYLATDDAALIEGCWSPAAAVRSARTAAALAHRAGARRQGLAVTGAALRAQLRAALTTLGSPPALAGQAGHPLPDQSLAWTETRLRTLEVQESSSPATAPVLAYAARAEHQLIAEMLSVSAYGPATAARLFYLGSRAARLSACLSTCLVETAAAERYALSSVRSGAAAGAGRQVVAGLATLAGIHAVLGDPHDALLSVGAARRVREASSAAHVLDCWEALARTRLTDAPAGLRSLRRAERTVDGTTPTEAESMQETGLGSGPAPETPPAALDAMRVALCSGLAWLEQGHSDRALTEFTALTSSSPHEDVPSPFAPGVLRYIAQAQLTSGAVDAAVLSTQQATAIAGRLPVALAEEFRQLFAPHLDEPQVRNVLETLPRHGQTPH
ncbi:hypothetical protein OG478_12600 [Streptomyces phaeochromogenes]|uniref:hypothetical protein n=1 Tax=Streptomyces phaeochromogenes TaxID=1923 RepID=UPI00387019F7|nr:hypothetical protein OG478_12600 [Streptomyces phaeochromogenes]